MALFGGLANLAIAALIALGLGAVIRAPDETFHPGLRAALIAGLIAVVVYWLLGSVFPGTPRWLTAVVLAPLIEEVSRLWYAVQTKSSLLAPMNWFFFALGFAALEAVNEWGAAGFAISAGSVGAEALIPPFISFLMHITIGMLVCGLMRAGWRQGRLLVLAMSLHALHNWSAVIAEIYQPQVRILLFLLMIGSIFKWGERFAPVTNPPDRASTPP